MLPLLSLSNVAGGVPILTNAYLPYAITEIYCLVFASIIWLRLNSSLGSEHEVRQLRNMICSYLGMLITDVFWALTENGTLHPPRLLNAAVNAVTVICVACGCYFWFCFIEDRLHFSHASDKRFNRLLKVPMLTVVALDTASIFTGWLFYIDDQRHYQSTSLFGIQTAVDYFYLLIPTIWSVCRAVRTRSSQERAEYWTYALYMVAPLLAGVLEDSFPHVPLLALNIFMMILILFLMIQNMQVYHDALTGLNNRRRLNRYLQDCLPKASAERPLLLFIMDINSFKSINDLYGHLEGDHALQLFAGVIRDVSARHFAFAARYGGDEFCMVMDAQGHTPEEITAEIRQALSETKIVDIEGNRPYSMTVSIGYTVCSSEGSQPELVLARADKQLYEEKKNWHLQNG